MASGDRESTSPHFMEGTSVSIARSAKVSRLRKVRESTPLNGLPSTQESRKMISKDVYATAKDKIASAKVRLGFGSGGRTSAASKDSNPLKDAISYKNISPASAHPRNQRNTSSYSGQITVPPMARTMTSYPNHITTPDMPKFASSSPISAMSSSPLDNKPLPSVPAATFKGDSPKQRRSLIDAEEKPLNRRFVISQGGGMGYQPWYPLSPTRPVSAVSTISDMPKRGKEDEEEQIEKFDNNQAFSGNPFSNSQTLLHDDIEQGNGTSTPKSGYNDTKRAKADFETISQHSMRLNAALCEQKRTSSTASNFLRAEAADSPLSAIDSSKVPRFVSGDHSRARGQPTSSTRVPSRLSDFSNMQMAPSTPTGGPNAPTAKATAIKERLVTQQQKLSTRTIDKPDPFNQKSPARKSGVFESAVPTIEGLPRFDPSTSIVNSPFGRETQRKFEALMSEDSTKPIIGSSYGYPGSVMSDLRSASPSDALIKRHPARIVAGRRHSSQLPVSVSRNRKSKSPPASRIPMAKEAYTKDAAKSEIAEGTAERGTEKSLVELGQPGLEVTPSATPTGQVVDDGKEDPVSEGGQPGPKIIGNNTPVSQDVVDDEEMLVGDHGPLSFDDDKESDVGSLSEIEPYKQGYQSRRISGQYGPISHKADEADHVILGPGGEQPKRRSSIKGVFRNSIQGIPKSLTLDSISSIDTRQVSSRISDVEVLKKFTNELASAASDDDPWIPPLQSSANAKTTHEPNHNFSSSPEPLPVPNNTPEQVTNALPASVPHHIHLPRDASAAPQSSAKKLVNKILRRTPSTDTPQPEIIVMTQPTGTPADELINLARDEANPGRRARLLGMARALIGGIIQSNNAARAREEAEQAALRAERAALMCRQALEDAMRAAAELLERER